LNPVACLIVAALTSIFTLIINKYFLTASETESEGVFKKMMKNYGKIFYRILFSLVGSITAAIVVATRDGQTPALLSNNYSKIAGF
jgi:H+/Cl- antiporter ClcA